MIHFAHTIPKLPCLPQLDPDPDARALSLARDRERFQFTFANHDIGFARSVPRTETLTPDYIALVTALNLQLKANRALAEVLLARDAGRLEVRSALAALLDGARNRLLDALYAPKRNPDVIPYPAREPEPLSSYRTVFALIPQPRVVNVWSEDVEHAWQRLAGVGPVVIERSDPGLRERVAITEALYRRAVGGGDTLEAALAEGRLFECRYPILEGIDPGTTDGLRHYLAAPVGLYVVPAGGATRHRPLVPVCIQTTPKPSPDHVFAPGDGWAWEMAKATLQSSDDNYHGVVEHLGRCHVLVLQFAIATYRSLPDVHPVRVLLTPHFELTFPVVNTLTQELLLPGGRTPRLQSVSVDGAIELLKRGLTQMRWNAMHPPDVFASKGVLEADVLSTYPYRDDSLPLWDAIRSFVEKYVRLYYGSDADVASDRELAAWMCELTSQHGARIRDIGEDGRLETVAGLVRLVSQLIWRVSAYHNVINYTVYDTMSYPPNLATAQLAPPPVRGREYSEADLRAMLAPIELVFEVLDDVYVVGNLRVNQLGHYPVCTFADARVMPLIAQLRCDLDRIEHATRERDAHRRASFPYLYPSHVAASIQV